MKSQLKSNLQSKQNYPLVSISICSLIHLFINLFPDKPSAPRDLVVTTTDKGQISVAWQPPENNGGSPITEYILETCRSTSSTWMEAGKVDGSTLSHDITSLDNAQYYVRVFAKNEAGISKKYVDLNQPVFAGETMSMCL